MCLRSGFFVGENSHFMKFPRILSLLNPRNTPRIRILPRILDEPRISSASTGCGEWLVKT